MKFIILVFTDMYKFSRKDFIRNIGLGAVSTTLGITGFDRNKVKKQEKYALLP